MSWVVLVVVEFIPLSVHSGNDRPFWFYTVLMVHVILYTTDFNSPFFFGVAAHQFVDDSQACIHGPVVEAICPKWRNLFFLSEVLSVWISSNRLWLNCGKPSSSGWLPLADLLNRLVHYAYLMSLYTIMHDLSVILNQGLAFSEHVDNVCRTCFYPQISTIGFLQLTPQQSPPWYVHMTQGSP